MNVLFHFLFNVFKEFSAKFICGFLGQMPTDIWSKLYTHWLKLCGAKIGKGSIIHHKVQIWIPENIEIGKNVQIPASTDMAGMAKIAIGDNTLIGANVSFITNHHPLSDYNLTKDEKLLGTQQPINVGHNCWIMNNVILVAGSHGLTIEDYSWIATGAVVTKNIPGHSLFGGIPAKRIKQL